MTEAQDPRPTESAAPPASSGRWRRWLRWIVKALGLFVLAVVLLGITTWAMLALYYADLSGGGTPRRVTTAIFAIVAIATVIFVRPRRYGVAILLLMFGAVLTWFLLLKPSNTRDWLPDVAEVVSVEITGDRMTVHNVRNFDYRSETDYTPRWEDRTYDLNTIRGVDLMLVYWGSPSIAHAMVSFEFEGDQHLAVSIETRKEKSESYSAVQGFFRQYELYYVFADERDVVRVRTHFRNEDVYLYHTNVSPAHAKALLLTYAQHANALAKRPQFYNALTSNCATNVVAHLRESNPSTLARVNWEILLSGHAARRAYRNGRLDTSMPFDELQARSHINAAARAADNDPNFAKAIRIGLPRPADAAR